MCTRTNLRAEFVSNNSPTPRKSNHLFACPARTPNQSTHSFQTLLHARIDTQTHRHYQAQVKTLTDT